MMTVKELKNGKHEYELTTNAGTRALIVRNIKTGKWFVLAWSDIVEMAVEAGINTPHEEEKR